MFICNIKVSGSKIFKIFAIGVSILVFILFTIGIYRIYCDAKSNVDCGYSSVKDTVDVIETKNYTNILQAVHDHLNDYVRH